MRLPALLKKAVKAVLPQKASRAIGEYLHCPSGLLERSLRLAVAEQRLGEIFGEISKAVPDIRGQYTRTDIGTGWLNTKTRAHHAFQVSLVKTAFRVSGVNPAAGPLIADIGDSAGTHLKYISSLYPGIKTLGVNLDAAAVERIRGRGLNAVCSRAEDLSGLSINADIYLAFELLEHLQDPVQFLHSLSVSDWGKALVITVPFIRRSRVGLHHIRRGWEGDVFAENTHLFELCPEDWRLLFLHSGWRPVFERVYLQYPLRSPLRLMKNFWKKLDFEGSYGAVLMKDQAWSRRYRDWQARLP